jgi:hypothetical protein
VRGRIYSRTTHTAPFAGYPGSVVRREVDHVLASRWVSEQLPDRIAAVLDFACGTWAAPLPEGAPPPVASDFRSGVLPEAPVEEWRAYDSSGLSPETLERMTADLQCSPQDLVLVPTFSLVPFAARWIVDHLAGDPANIALVREMTPKAVEGVPAWRGEAGTFYVLAGPAWEQERVAQLLDDASASWGEFAVLTTATPEEAQSRVVSGEELLAFIARAQGIIVGAYDGEGYLYWSRSRHCPTSASS